MSPIRIRAAVGSYAATSLHRRRLLRAGGILWFGLAACGSPDKAPVPEGLSSSDYASGSSSAEGVSASGGFPIRIMDATGDEVTFQGVPQRIISLVPSATEALMALGAQGLLVGRTDYDTTAAMVHLPSVGGGLDPNLESLLMLEPDLVLRFAGESDTSTPRRMDEFGIRHLALRLDRMADVRTLVRDLGSITGRTDRAGDLVTRIDADLAEVRRRVQREPRKSVAYILGGNPPWVAGPGTFIDELLTLAGGRNAFSDLKGLYGPVSTEAFLVREIDLLLAPEGAEVLLPTDRVPLRRVSPSLELPGPNLARSALELARILHPGVFR